MSCLYDEPLEPYYCEADWNCKDCPNWIEEDETAEEVREEQAKIEQLEHDILYEPTFSEEDGSM